MSTAVRPPPPTRRPRGSTPSDAAPSLPAPVESAASREGRGRNPSLHGLRPRSLSRASSVRRDDDGEKGTPAQQLPPTSRTRSMTHTAGTGSSRLPSNRPQQLTGRTFSMIPETDSAEGTPRSRSPGGARARPHQPKPSPQQDIVPVDRRAAAVPAATPRAEPCPSGTTARGGRPAPPLVRTASHHVAKPTDASPLSPGGTYSPSRAPTVPTKRPGGTPTKEATVPNGTHAVGIADREANRAPPSGATGSRWDRWEDAGMTPPEERSHIIPTLGATSGQGILAPNEAAAVAEDRQKLLDIRQASARAEIAQDEETNYRDSVLRPARVALLRHVLARLAEDEEPLRRWEVEAQERREWHAWDAEEDRSRQSVSRTRWSDDLLPVRGASVSTSSSDEDARPPAELIATATLSAAAASTAQRAPQPTSGFCEASTETEPREWPHGSPSTMQPHTAEATTWTEEHGGVSPRGLSSVAMRLSHAFDHSFEPSGGSVAGHSELAKEDPVAPLPTATLHSSVAAGRIPYSSTAASISLDPHVASVPSARLPAGSQRVDSPRHREILSPSRRSANHILSPAVPTKLVDGRPAMVLSPSVTAHTQPASLGRPLYPEIASPSVHRHRPAAGDRWCATEVHRQGVMDVALTPTPFLRDAALVEGPTGPRLRVAELDVVVVLCADQGPQATTVWEHHQSLTSSLAGRSPTPVGGSVRFDSVTHHVVLPTTTTDGRPISLDECHLRVLLRHYLHGRVVARGSLPCHALLSHTSGVEATLGVEVDLYPWSAEAAVGVDARLFPLPVRLQVTFACA